MCVYVSMLAFVCMHARVREGVCVSASIRWSVRMSVCLSACMFVRPNVCSQMRAFINAYATFLISNFLLLTSSFHVYTLVCLYLSIYPCVSMCVHPLYVFDH